MITRRSLLLASPAIILPRRLRAQAIGNNGISAAAGGSSSSSSVNLSPYIGLVGTRGTVNQQVSAGNFYANSQSFHYARTNITTLQVALGAYYCNGVENNMGGPVTYNASINFPTNTYSDFKWNGSTSGTVADGKLFFSDPLPISIPAGTIFGFRAWQDAHLTTSGVACGWTGYAAGGDGIEVSPTSIASKTDGGTIGFTQGLGPIFPMALIGVTNQPSVGCIGDSRVMGLADTADVTGDIGELARSMGPSFAYINAGCSGENAFNFGNTFGTNPTDFINRTALINAFCTHVICEWGVNDIKNSQSAAQTLTSLELCWQRFPNLKVFQTTIPPYSNDPSNLYETLVAQTPVAPFTAGAGGIRQTLNATLRAGGLSGLGLTGGTFDITPVTESSLNSGLWAVNGTPDWYTPDGLHETATANIAYVTAGVIPPSAIHR